MTATGIDLHTHSVVSDGTDSPAEVVRQAAASGLSVVALTDHDTFDGLDEAIAAGRAVGVKVLPGIEISTQRSGASVHLLGYGCRRDDPDLTTELGRVRASRTGRVEAMAQRLTELGLPITADDILTQAGDSPSVGRPHVADALIAAGHVNDRREAFDRWLADDRPGYVHRYATPLERGIDLVHGAGGVAVIAHPWGRGRDHDLPEAYLAHLVAEHGLDGVEVDHQDHAAKTREALWRLVKRLGVVGTGSSDFHGTGKVDHDLGCNQTSGEALATIVGLIGQRGGWLPDNL